MRYLTTLVLALLLAGCSQDPQGMERSEALATMDVAEAPTAPAAPNAGGGAAAPAPLKVSVPQMAYKYGYVFRLPEAAVAAAQARHMALCERLGPDRCQLLSMTGAGGEGGRSAALKLRVESRTARAFGTQLTASIAAAGGRTVTSTIAADDVSKDIIDTEARLRQRELLVARLTEILRTRHGKVAELVEAERSVAAAQEEIDQARSWLAELRGRVAMATIDIAYEPVAAGPAAARGGLGDAVAQSGSAFVAGVSAILQIAIFLAPWALLAGLGWMVVRALRRRRAAGEDEVATD